VSENSGLTQIVSDLDKEASPALWDAHSLNDEINLKNTGLVYAHKYNKICQSCPMLFSAQ
jgi:hypothetical protein